MKIGNKKLLIYIFIVIYLFTDVRLEIIKDEKDFINKLSSDVKVLVLDIENEISISNDINIKNTFEKIVITGNSVNTAKLKFLDLSHHLFFGNNIKEIELKNLSIKGNLHFQENTKVDIQSVSLHGYIDSNFSLNNGYINFSNFTYETSSVEVYNCINLEGNVNIDNSKFLGSSSCHNRLINFNGKDKYTLKIKDSFFNGDYRCPFLNINNGKNVDINNSTFEKAFSPVIIEGGSIVWATNSYIYIKNCTLRDNLSEEKGGAFNLHDLYDFEADHLDIYNTTAFKLGSMAYIVTSEEIKSVSKFSNIRQIDTGNLKGMTRGGLIMGLEKSANVVIDNYYAENLINNYESACAFIISEYVSLTINNLTLKTVYGKGINGLLVLAQDCMKVTINGSNISIIDAHQTGVRETGIIWVKDNTQAFFDNLTIKDSGGYYTKIIYQEGNSEVVMNNMSVDNFFSHTAIELFHCSSKNDGISLKFVNLKVNNIYSRGVLFRIPSGGHIVLIDSEIRNIHPCYLNNSCDTDIEVNNLIYESEIVYLSNKSLFTVNNTIFENIYGDYAIGNSSNGKLILNGSEIRNCYFKYGFIRVDEKNKLSGDFVINDSYFYDIKAKSGPIVHVDHLFKTSQIKLNFTNNVFENNVADYYGGVIYSVSPYSYKILTLENCTYTNNTAPFGRIVYSYDIHSEPNITNVEDIKVIKENFATNPTELRMNIDIDEISLLSGEMLPDGISCSVYDDYNNLILFDSDISNVQFDEFIFYTLEINDPYNVVLMGQSKSYCWGDSCIFPPIRIVGNPGNYILRLKINTYGKFSEFKKNYYDININIKECEKETYMFQHLDSPKFKSCYQPFCEPSCNKGKCININLCNCTDTLFTGSHCDQYYQLERLNKLNLSVRIITYVLIVATIIVSIMTFILRNNPTIKGGSVDFLMIILFGLLINFMYVFFLTMEKTKKNCILIFLFDNIGFSLVFGSILVKTLRIYRIFNIKMKNNMGLRKEIMYGFVISLVLFYSLVIVVWVKTNKVYDKNFLTNDNKEYKRCVYPKFKTICIMINFVILAIGYTLSYLIRNVKKNFKENLGIPVYVYVTTVTIKYIVEFQDDIPITVQDLFGYVGTIINTFVILYYLYINKIYTIHVLKSLDVDSQKKVSQPITL